MAFWDLAKYGWQPNYWLTVGGIPVCFSELATGQTAPAGFVIDPCLVIDNSASIGSQINRENGSANALPLTFRLLDSVNGTPSQASTWLRKWAKQCTLTANLTAVATTVTVDDTTGWSNGDYLYAGGECIQIGTVASGTSFTGCTRGARGTLAAVHKTGLSGQMATDLPKLRGADVVLWASPLDPAGYASGVSLADEATMIWRGRVSDYRRVNNGFDFECSSLDRILDTPLVAKISGKIESYKHMNPIVSMWSLMLALRGQNAAGTNVLDTVIKIAPFTNYVNGTLAYAAEVKAAIVTAFASAVTTAGVGAYVGDLSWVSGEDYDAKTWLCVRLQGLYNTSVTWSVCGSTPKKVIGNGCGYSDTIAFWQTVNPCGGSELGAGGDMLTIAVEGNPADVPAGPGRVKVELNSATYSYYYATATAGDGVVYLTQVVPATAGAPQVHLQAKTFLGASAEIEMISTGTPATLALRCLESSGTASLRGTYDTLPQGGGYSIPAGAIDEASFANALAPVAKLTATTSTAGAGFFDVYGGILGLFRRGVVLRPDAAGIQRLTCIPTTLGGSDWVVTVTDADLLCLAGEPVISIDKMLAPNVIKVTRATTGGASSEDGDVTFFTDDPSVEAEGARQTEFSVPGDVYDDWHALTGAAALAQFGTDATTQAVTLRIPPWIDAQVGDCVQLSLTHPSLYSWASGTQGLTGVGRVTGRALELKSGITTITVLCESNLTTHSLAPAMKVTAHTGTGASPSTVTVDQKYYKHLTTALAFASGPIQLACYDPGDVETTSCYLTVSAVSAPSGGSITLTTSGMSGGAITDSTTYLTLPTSTPSGPSITSYQAGFSHDADGSYWT